MTLVEHLGELRTRVMVCAVTFVITGTVAFLFYPRILSFLQHPYCEVAPSHCGFYITGPLDGLALRVKIAAYGGLFLASPVLLWEFWRFITPGLKPNEKRYAIPFIVASIALFALGCAVAFFTFPHALRWLDSIGGPSLHEIFDPINYLGLIVLLMVCSASPSSSRCCWCPWRWPACSPRSSCPRGDGGPSWASWWWPGW